MSRYQPFHDLPAAQFEGLKKDIEARGIVQPILVDENGKTIDGHQRRRAAAELGIDCPSITVEGLSEDDKISLAIALNTFRRHLTGAERSLAIQQMANLGMSVRRIAKTTGIPRRTVRRDLEAMESGGPHGPPDGVGPDTGEVTDTSGSGDSEREPEAAGSGVDEQPVEPAPSPAPNPTPRKVTGGDGKQYPAKRTKPESSPLDDLAKQVSKSDIGYRAATSKELSKVRSGLLTLDAERSASVVAPDDRSDWLAFVDQVSTWLATFEKALSATNLRSVK